MAHYASALVAPPEDDAFALTALKIVLFSGFGIVATILGFVFFMPAGFVLAGMVAWLGFEGVYGPYRSFALRALSMVFFAAFAVIATIMGFVHAPPLGFALAALFLWRGFGRFGAGAAAEQVAPRTPEAALRPTGNEAFDAYRTDMLQRLEDERAQFEGFLARLRAAKDSREFDQFMEDRARRAREARGD
ncbi:hypothetical protein GCM10011392_14100 [Wenxinia marina]|uniref:DUF2852 domain-containing protein n=1 Tax=Wenxinia marina TaxID=390641 RepID=UPI0003627AB2|nr:DUF2852 domain-containing protein [Wenxinia marina]GGL60818.1 hypothetical protein GCM10011392_14100 [Wenxinia marina]